MDKLEQLKEAIKNPPPERLAAIEYRSHFLSILGIITVCVFLVLKGFWYIIFAMIFGVGVSYSQGMTAYKKYQNIIAIVGKKEELEDLKDDPSPSRMRGKIIDHVYGKKMRWLTLMFSVVLTYFFLKDFNPDTIFGNIVLTFGYMVMTLGLFAFIYYVGLYAGARLSYDLELKEMKGGGLNDKEKRK